MFPNDQQHPTKRGHCQSAPPPALTTSSTTMCSTSTRWTNRESQSRVLLAPKNWPTNTSRSTNQNVIYLKKADIRNLFAQDFNSGLFLARGHLAPNADFIFYSLMVHHGEKNKFHLVEINCNVYSIFANGHFLKIFTLSGFHISLYQCGSPVAVLQRYNIDIDIDINDR